MYHQKLTNVNRSDPKLWKWSSVILGLSIFLSLRSVPVSVTDAKEATTAPAKKYTPNIVENQCGSSDIIQSIDDSVTVNAKTGINPAANLIFLRVRF